MWRSWTPLLRKAVKSYLFCSIAAYVLLALVFGAIIYGLQKKKSSAVTHRFIDTLYTACSALTETGT